MTPVRFTECLGLIHWSTETLAGVLECDESLTEAWALGLADVPTKAAAWLEVLAVAHQAAASGRPKGLKGKRYTGMME